MSDWIKDKNLGPWDFTEQSNKWGYLNNPRWSDSTVPVNYDHKTEPQVWSIEDGKIGDGDFGHLPCGHWHKKPVDDDGLPGADILIYGNAESNGHTIWGVLFETGKKRLTYIGSYHPDNSLGTDVQLKGILFYSDNTLMTSFHPGSTQEEMEKTVIHVIKDINEPVFNKLTEGEEFTAFSYTDFYTEGANIVHGGSTTYYADSNGKLAAFNPELELLREGIWPSVIYGTDGKLYRCIKNFGASSPFSIYLYEYSLPVTGSLWYNYFEEIEIHAGQFIYPTEIGDSAGIVPNGIFDLHYNKGYLYIVQGGSAYPGNKLTKINAYDFTLVERTSISSVNYPEDSCICEDVMYTSGGAFYCQVFAYDLNTSPITQISSFLPGGGYNLDPSSADNGRRGSLCYTSNYIILVTDDYIADWGVFVLEKRSLNVIRFQLFLAGEPPPILNWSPVTKIAAYDDRYIIMSGNHCVEVYDIEKMEPVVALIDERISRAANRLAVNKRY